jgi:Ca-activated chloride channel family protein
MHKPTLVFSPLRKAVPAQGGSIDLLLRVQAPDRPADLTTQHTPKRLALVVDRSGSMSGEPLDEALKCVTHIAKHLTPKDELSVVVYDSQVDVLMPIGPMLSQDDVNNAISGVVSGGSTNLHGGWLAGAEELEGGSANSISRVLLLSDGQVNAGLRSQSEIETQCRTWQSKGVTTTTVGLGRNFNEDLMTGMAQAGGGQNYYGQRAEDLFDNFDEELALLQAMYVRNLSMKLNPATGVIVEMLSPITQQADGTYRMTDLAWNSESWIAVRLHVSPMKAGSPRDLLAITVCGKAMDGAQIEITAPLFQLQSLDEDRFAQLPVDELVQRRLNELRFAKASSRLRDFAQAGLIDEARELLDELEREFGNNPWLSAKIEQLRRLTEDDLSMMMKEVSYTAFRMSRRLTSKSEMLFGKDETDSQIPAFLRKKVEEGRGRSKR